MKARPILFSGEMVRALLDGRKGQTRRVVKAVHIKKASTCRLHQAWKLLCGCLKKPGAYCPYGQPGDLLWVKESWRKPTGGELLYGYRLDTESNDVKWENSMFMPRKASRLTLEIKDIRVERVQDISEEDAKAEGSQIAIADLPKPCQQAAWSEKQQFSRIWDFINNKPGKSWDDNPWVWVVVFKVHQINVDEFLEKAA